MQRRALFRLLARSAAACAGAALGPMRVAAAEEKRVYADTRYVEGADDTLGHWLELAFHPAGKPVSGELRLYEGPPEPTLRLALSVRATAAGRGNGRPTGFEIVCSGKDPGRGMVSLRGTLTDAAVRGELRVGEEAPVRLRLLRQKE